MRQMRRGLSERERPPGIADASSTDIISGILDIVRTGEGPEASRKWAAACMLSGECIKACDYGVNPRFLLAMARVAMAKSQNELPERRRQGVTHVPRRQPRCDHAVAVAARRRGAGAARPEIGVGRDTGRGAGLRVLHRLQCAEDAAYRAARARHHGCARHHLSGDGRADAIAAASRSCVPATSRCPGAWARTRSRRCRIRSPAR